ncbi:oligosaccharide flippase family protein [Persicobacter psychrovividus]|uniref:Polysaccharide biosynthesis protein n=1 Tax=Persicobacter psychrovividus TaxID=387638 RepID=A0ABM7VB71_9BACT|nr:polysaccharide biosynthesis protein [Persicobacter psychrovividus]
MSRLKKLAGDTVLYGMSSIVGRTLNYFLVPLYTKFLSPSEYGVVTELYAYVAFFLILFTFGMETTFFRFVSQNKADTQKIFNRVLSIVMIVDTILALGLVACATPIMNYLEYPGKEAYVYALAFILMLDGINAFPFAKLRIEGRAKRFAITKMINILVNMGLNIILLVGMNEIMTNGAFPALYPFVSEIYTPALGPAIVIFSNMVASMANSVMHFGIYKRFRFKLDWKTVRPMVIYGVPLLFMGVAGTTSEMFSRLMLKKILPVGFYPGYTNQQILGIFGACYKLAIFMNLAIQAYKYAAEPFFFNNAQDKNSPALLGKVTHVFTAFGSIAFLAVVANLDIISHLFLRQKAYRMAMDAVPILLMANLFLGIYYNLSMWYKLTDKTYFGTYLSVGGAIMTIVLNYFLIPVIGYMGSAWATFAVYGGMTVVSYILGKKHYPVPYQVGRGLLYLSTSGVLAYCCYHMHFDNYLILKGIQLLIFLIFVAMVFILERKMIQRRSV